MKLITSVLGMSAVILFAFTANGYCQVEEDLDKKIISYMVKLDPKWDTDSLEVKKVGKCKKNDHPGCLLFEKDHEGSITFYLKSNGKTCDKNASEVITKVELATKASPENPFKGDFSGTREDWVKTYAFQSIDLNTGVVFDAPWHIATTAVTLTNLNSQPNEMGEKQFWYKVTVTKCSEPSDTLSTDPRGDNEGRH